MQSHFGPRTCLTLAIALVGIVSGCQFGPPVVPSANPQIIEPATPTAEQEARLTEAAAASSQGRYDDALELFQEILAENPTITTAYLGIGEIYLVREEYDRAEPVYARAARLEPRNFDAQYGHGLSLQMLARYTEAVRAYHRALTIQPDSPEANLNLATTYLQLEDPARAVVFAERAVEADSSNGAARANLGAIYEEIGRNVDAIEAYTVALELMGNQPPLMLNLINVLARENRYREAANTADILVRFEPSAESYERLGWCRFKLRDYDASMEAYRAAVEIDPGHWPAHNGIGVNALNAWILSKKRDSQARTDAGRAFRQSLRMNPDQDKVAALIFNYDL